MTILRQFLERHPNLAAWIVLAVGMVAILIWASKDAALLPTQRLALGVITVLVAGLCVWIINWE